MERYLEGKSALVTGSTSGIGQSIARVLAAKGCHLVINGFGDASEIESFCRAMEAEHGVVVTYDGADMSKPEEIEAMMSRVNQRFSGVDILVNNAGIQHVCSVEDFPVDKWNAILAINLSSAFHTIRAAIPSMKEKGWGRIINIASAHALIASPYKSAYVAAKHGVAGLTKSVALEVAQSNITCNAICPGYVMTPLVEGQLADTAKARGISEQEVKEKVMLARQATKEFVAVEEVANFAAFLCRNESRNITGAVLPIDGGWTAS